MFQRPARDLLRLRGVDSDLGFGVGEPVSASLVGLVPYHAALVYDQNNNFYLGTNPTTLLLEQ